MHPGLEEQSHLRSLVSRYARSLDAADIPAVLQCLADDVSLSYDGGQLQIDGKAAAERFFGNVLREPSTHLLSNYGFERRGTEIVVSCSAIACVFRDPGAATMKGLVYSFTCAPGGSNSRIRRLEHRATWEFSVPVSPDPPASGNSSA